MHWTQEEEEELTSHVLASVEKGMPMNEIFHHASRQLGRTEQACYIRWYTKLRPKLGASIEIAKKQQAPKKRASRSQPNELDSIVNQLRSHQKYFEQMSLEHRQLNERLMEKNLIIEELRKRVQEKEEEILRLQAELGEMQKRIEALGVKGEIIEDYQKMLEILSRAREMSLREEMKKTPASAEVD